MTAESNVIGERHGLALRTPIMTCPKKCHLRAHTLGPCGNGSFEGLLFCQTTLTEAVMVEVKGDRHTCSQAHHIIR